MTGHVITRIVILAAIGPMGVDFALRDEDQLSYYGIEHVVAALHRTFSDTLMHYAKKHGLHINGAQPYIAVAWTIGFDVTKVTNEI